MSGIAKRGSSTIEIRPAKLMGDYNGLWIKESIVVLGKVL